MLKYFTQDLDIFFCFIFIIIATFAIYYGGWKRTFSMKSMKGRHRIETSRQLIRRIKRRRKTIAILYFILGNCLFLTTIFYSYKTLAFTIIFLSGIVLVFISNSLGKNSENNA